MNEDMYKKNYGILVNFLGNVPQTLLSLYFCHLLKTFENTLDADQADKMSGFILIYTFWHLMVFS